MSAHLHVLPSDSNGIVLTAHPQDASGKAREFRGTLAWEVSDSSLGNVEPKPGNTGKVTLSGALGKMQVRAVVDSNIDPEYTDERPVVGVWDVEVVPPHVTQVVLTAEAI